MPLPIVRPRRKHWYNVKSGKGKGYISNAFDYKLGYEESLQNVTNFENPEISSNVSEYIKINRRKYHLISDFDEDFFNDYEDILNNICYQLSLEATEVLQDFIYDKAYVEYTTDSGYSQWYHRTYDFPTAFNVYIYPTAHTLAYQIAFFYDTLTPAKGIRRKTKINVGLEGSELKEYNVYRNLMPRYLSIYGIDKRKDLPDILNTPVTVYHSELIRDRRKRKRIWTGSANIYYQRKVGRREGRWYESFDKWFRTEGYIRFLKLCKEEELI